MRFVLSGLLASLLVGSLLLACPRAAAPPAADDLGGRWSGELTFTQGNRERALPVVVELEQTGHRLSGFLQATQATETVGEPGSMSGRRFDLVEGLAADGEVFFHARTMLPIGTATVFFSGSVTGHADGSRLSGEARIDLSTTEGKAELPGRLAVERTTSNERRGQRGGEADER